MNYKKFVAVLLVISIFFGNSISIFAEENFVSKDIIWNDYYDGVTVAPYEFKDDLHVETETETVPETTGPSGPEVVEYYDYDFYKTHGPLAASDDVDLTSVGKGLYYDGENFYFFADTGVMANNFMITIEGDRFFFGEDGKMVKNEFIDYEGEFYYFDINGAMAKNRWVTREIADTYENTVEYFDYYFGPTGRAYKAGDGSYGLVLKTIDDRKYGFNSDAEKVEGYYDYMGNKYEPSDTEAYQYCDYYFDPTEDGAAYTGWLYYDGSVRGSEYDDDEEICLYFDDKTCRKIRSNSSDPSRCVSRTIEGQRYMFDCNGVRKNKWYNVEPNRGTYSNARYFNDDEEGYLQKGWFVAVPPEDSILELNRERHTSGEEVWYYATSNGSILRKTIRRIGGHVYAFDDDGVMQEDAMVKVRNGNFVKSYRVEDLTRNNVILDADEYGQADTGADTLDPEKGLLNDGEQWMYFYGDAEESMDGALCGINKEIKVELKDNDIFYIGNSTGGYAATNTADIVIRNDRYIQNGVVLKPNQDDNNYGLIRQFNYNDSSLGGKRKVEKFYNAENILVEEENDIYTYLLVNSHGSIINGRWKCIKDKQGYYIYIGNDGEFLGAYISQGRCTVKNGIPHWQYRLNKTWVDGMPPETDRVDDKYLWLNFNENGYSGGPTVDGYASLMYKGLTPST